MRKYIYDFATFWPKRVGFLSSGICLMLNTFFHYEPEEFHYHKDTYQMIMATIDRPQMDNSRLNIVIGLLEDVLTSFKD